MSTPSKHTGVKESLQYIFVTTKGSDATKIYKYYLHFYAS